jgi:hypothetical protein
MCTVVVLEAIAAWLTMISILAHVPLPRIKECSISRQMISDQPGSTAAEINIDRFAKAKR